jgi:hypothetical protein
MDKFSLVSFVCVVDIRPKIFRSCLCFLPVIWLGKSAAQVTPVKRIKITDYARCSFGSFWITIVGLGLGVGTGKPS